MLDNVRSTFESLASLCEPVYLENLLDRVNEAMKRWDRVIQRLNNTLTTVEVSARATFKLTQVLPQGRTLHKGMCTWYSLLTRYLE